eukprot:1409582-Pleurochrysis_carterae.AAC.1
MDNCHNALGRSKLAVCGRKSKRNCADKQASGVPLRHSSWNCAPVRVLQTKVTSSCPSRFGQKQALANLHSLDCLSQQ